MRLGLAMLGQAAAVRRLRKGWTPRPAKPTRPERQMMIMDEDASFRRGATQQTDPTDRVRFTPEFRVSAADEPDASLTEAGFANKNEVSRKSARPAAKMAVFLAAQDHGMSMIRCPVHAVSRP